MRFASLGSGSRGNATVVAHDSELILVDCGFTIKETCQRLERLGVTASQLTAIVVTHEHGDHIKGVAPLARRFDIPTYMTPGTFHSRHLGNIPQLHLIHGYQPFQLGQVNIIPVAVPHDAREPAQYVFEVGELRLGVLTDLGNISSHVESFYNQCDALVLEANHDPQMLASGPYPYSLKQRVGGLWGHLSNQQASAFLQRVNLSRLQRLVIAHISQQNNSLAHVRAAVTHVVDEVADIIYACQNEGFGWQNVQPKSFALL